MASLNYSWRKYIDRDAFTFGMVLSTSVFKTIWVTIEAFMKEQIVVGHNTLDVKLLWHRRALAVYDVAKPRYERHWPYLLYKKYLTAFSQEHHVSLNHHDALNNVNACAELFYLYRTKGNY